MLWPILQNINMKKIEKTISEIQIIPVKPNNGLVAFSSFVLFESLYCSSVGVVTRPNGGYRLVYPTKKVGDKQLHLFHPINIMLSSKIELAVSKQLEKILSST